MSTKSPVLISAVINYNCQHKQPTGWQIERSSEVLINPEITTWHTDAQKDAGDKEMLTSNLIIFETANYSTGSGNALLLLVMSPTGTGLNRCLQPSTQPLSELGEDNIKQKLWVPWPSKSKIQWWIWAQQGIADYPSRVLKLGWYMTFYQALSGNVTRGK